MCHTVCRWVGCSHSSKLMPKISCYTFLYFSPFISSARLFYNVIPLTCYYWSLFSSGISNMGHQHCKQRNLESSLYYITLYRDTVPEIIDSGPICITNLFQNKYLAYFNPHCPKQPIIGYPFYRFLYPTICGTTYTYLGSGFCIVLKCFLQSRFLVVEVNV